MHGKCVRMFAVGLMASGHHLGYDSLCDTQIRYVCMHLFIMFTCFGLFLMRFLFSRKAYALEYCLSG